MVGDVLIGSAQHAVVMRLIQKRLFRSSGGPLQGFPTCDRYSLSSGVTTQPVL